MDWKVRAGSVFLLLVLLPAIAYSGYAEKRVVCYYTNWSVYRPGTAKFSPQNINPYLCTHLIYAFGGFTKDNTLKPFDKYQDIEKGGYAKFTGLKTYNKDLKTLLAIGGWNEGSSRFSPMVNDPQRRREFVKNTVKFLRQNHFDGLDLDWEYPAFRDGGKPRDKDNYADLVEELRNEFDRESSKTGRPRLLLTMAVPAGIEYIDKGYDIPRLNEYLDFINLLSYDYHSAFEPAVNHHSPLYPLEEDNEYNYDNELTIDYTITHLLKKGASSDKIVLGIPTYGRSYTLFNEDATAIGSPADGPGTEGDATREKGYLAYYEICENLMREEWQVEQPNPKAMGPYAYYKNQWVGYDDEDIVREKSRYVLQKDLGGIMFWSIDNDDFRGNCHGRPYPLIEAAKEALLADSGNKHKEDHRPNSISGRTRPRLTGPSRPGNRKSTINDSSKRSKISTRPSTTRSSSSTKFRNRSNARAPVIEESEEEEEEDSREENVAKSSETSSKRRPPSKSRPLSRLSSGDRDNRKKQQNRENKIIQEPNSNKLTTPEPPTTPDPGSDFKCEDEGFFPHPRDCKKYFWCLDSGPSGLGVVAHQFTCPSGLVFNKAADSCDYPRNVICPKVKPKTAVTTTPSTTTTTRRTTTERQEEIIDEEDEEYEYEEEEEEVEEKKPEKEERSRKFTTTSTTTPKPLIYKTISRNRPTTTTSAPTTTKLIKTSTSATVGRAFDDFSEEEDPKVIKELIELIKKAGGIEHLEKQLAFQERNTGSESAVAESGHSTPATISRSLYERVLSRQSSKSNFFNVPQSRGVTNNRKSEKIVVEEEEEEVVPKARQPVDNKRFKSRFGNAPGRAQFDGLDDIPEVKSLRRNNKPQYVTIERHTTSSGGVPNEENTKDESEDSADDASSEEKLISNVSGEREAHTQRSTSGYVNIRRNRPKTTTTSSPSIENDVIEPDLEDDEPLAPHYRPHLSQNDEDIIDHEEPTTTPKTRYISLTRVRSTTENIKEHSYTPTSTQVPETTVSTTLKPTKPKPVYEIEEPEVSYPTVSVPPSTVQTTTRSPPTVSIVYSTHTLSPSDIKTTVSEEIRSTAGITPVYSVSTARPEPNYIDDTEIDVIELTTLSPIELIIPNTVGPASQPRPFGYPRRGRPTTSSSLNSVTSRRSSGVTEPTLRSKVSNNPRNNARSTTTAPQTRPRTRTRTRVRTGVTTNENARVEDKEIQKTTDTQDAQANAGVNSSRTRSRYRGTSRFGSGTSRGTTSREATESPEPTTKTYIGRRNRRPTTTTAANTDDNQIDQSSQNLSSRRRNFLSRQSKIKQETEDTIDKNQESKRRRIIDRTTVSIAPLQETTSTTEKSFETVFTEILEPEVDKEIIDDLNEKTIQLTYETTPDYISSDDETLDSLQTTFQMTDPSLIDSTEQPFSTIFWHDASDPTLGTSVTDTETIRLPTLRELVGYPTIPVRYDSSVGRYVPYVPTEPNVPVDPVSGGNDLVGDSYENFVPGSNSKSSSSLNNEAVERIVKVPMRIANDPTDEILSLHIPKEKVNLTSQKSANNAERTAIEIVTQYPKQAHTKNRRLGNTLHKPNRNKNVETSIRSVDDTHKTGRSFTLLEQGEDNSFVDDDNQHSTDIESTTSRRHFNSVSTKPSTVNNGGYSGFLITKSFEVTKDFTDFTTPVTLIDSVSIHENEVERTENDFPTVPNTREESMLKDVVTDGITGRTEFSQTKVTDNEINIGSTTVPEIESQTDLNIILNDETHERKTTLSLNVDFEKSDIRNEQGKLDTTLPETVTDVTTSGPLLTESLHESSTLTQSTLENTENSTQSLINMRERVTDTDLARTNITNNASTSIELSSTERIASEVTNRTASNGRGRVVKKRVLLYRGPTRHRSYTNSSRPRLEGQNRQKIMKKVVRKRIRQTTPNPLKTGDSKKSSSAADAELSGREVNVQRSPGSSHRRTGNSLHSRGTHSPTSTTRKPALPRIYPGESFRAPEDIHDQSSKAQSLDVALADPPSSSLSSDFGETLLVGIIRKKISTTVAPHIYTTPVTLSPASIIEADRRRQGQKYESTKHSEPNTYYPRSRSRRPQIVDYDYYEDEEERFIGKPKLQGKLYVTGRGGIHCLDQGHFPHPTSCKKFITCAKMVNGKVVGTEYTCPDKLSFDPVGGICNWSAGLGCKE